MLKDIATGIIITILFISLIIIFCVIIIKLYIKKIKEHNKKELQFQKTLNSSILETQKQLLTTISQDLHDDAGQQLTVINFQLENFKLEFPNQVEKIATISESITNLSSSLRKVSHSLNPNWLQANGLLTAIKAELTRIDNQKIINVTLQIIDSKNRRLNPDVEIVVFRIVQETINNVLKHAKATLIEVLIVTFPKLKIEISDNGNGFDFENNSVKNSIGIQNCIHRAKLIDYEFTISSVINVGTKTVLVEN